MTARLDGGDTRDPDGLRDALADVIVHAWRTANGYEKVLELAQRFADAVLALPAVAELLADRERVQRVRAVAAAWRWLARMRASAAATRELTMCLSEIRRALDGEA